METPEGSGPGAVPEPPRDALSNVEGIQNLDTARMALRWALERLRALEREAGGTDELRKRLERDYAGRRISLEREFQSLRSKIVTSTERRIKLLEDRLRGAKGRPGGSPAEPGDLKEFEAWVSDWERERDSLFDELRRTRLQTEPAQAGPARSEPEERDLADRLAETERARVLSEQTRQQELARSKAEALKHELEAAQHAGKTTSLEGMLNATRDLLSRAQSQSGEAQQVWRKQLEKLAAEVQDLRRELDERAAREAQTLARATISEQAADRSRQEMDRRNAELHAFQQERAGLNDQLAESKRTLQDHQARGKDLEARVQQAWQAQERLREELSRAAAREAEGLAQRETLQRRADEALERAAETQTRLQALETDYQRQRAASLKEGEAYRGESESRALRLQSEIDSLRERVRELGSAAASATDRASSLDRALEAESIRAQTARNDLENARRQLKTAEEAHSGLRNEAEARKSELSAALAEARKALAESRARVDELEARQSALQAELEVAQRSLAAAESSLRDWKGSFSAGTGAVASREAKLVSDREAALRAAEEAAARAAELSTRLAALQAEHERLCAAPAGKEEALRREAQARAERLEAELATVRERHREAHEAAEAAEKRSSTLRLELEAETLRAEGLKRDLENAQKASQTGEGGLAELRRASEERLAGLAAELARARQALLETQERADTLEARFVSSSAGLEAAQQSMRTVEGQLRARAQEAAAEASSASAHALELSTRLAAREADLERLRAVAGSEAQGQRAAFDARAEMLQEEIGTLQTLLREEEERRSKLADELTKAHVESEGRRAMAVDLEAQLGRVTKQLDAALARQSDSDARGRIEGDALATSLQEEIERLRRALSAAVLEREAAVAEERRRSEEAREELRAIEGRLEEASQSAALARAQAATQLEKERAFWREQGQPVEAELEALLKQSQDQAAAATEREAALRRERDALQEKLASAGAEAQRFRQEAADQSRRIAEAPELRQRLESAEELNRRQERIAAMERKLQDDYQRKRTELERLRAQFLAELDEVSKDKTKQQLERECAVLREQVEPVKAELEDLRKRSQDQAAYATEREEALRRERDALKEKLALVRSETGRMKEESADRQRLRAEVSELHAKLEPAEELRRRQARIETWERAVQDEYRRKKAEVEALRRQFLAELDQLSKDKPA